MSTDPGYSFFFLSLDSGSKDAFVPTKRGGSRCTETIGTADPSHSGPGQSHVYWRLWSYFIETADEGVGAGWRALIGGCGLVHF